MKTNKILAGLILLLGLFFFMPSTSVKAYTLVDSADGIWNYEVTGQNTIEIQGISNKNFEATYGSLSEISFPSTIDGYQVTSINLYQYSLSSRFTTVTIPEGITKIEAHFLGTFYDEKSLQAINLPASLTTIGNQTFSQFTGLSNVNFAPNSKLTTIEMMAFEKTTSLNSFDFMQFPKLTYIGNSSFSGSSLQKVELPNNLQIKYYAFGECPFLVSASVGANTVLDNSVFENDWSLTSADFKDGCSLSFNMFDDSKNLASLNLGNVKALGQNLSNSTKIKSLTIPKSCTSMPSMYGSDYNLVPKHVVLYVEKGSVAETYAKKLGYTYKYIGQKETKVAKVSSLKVQKKSRSSIKISWKKASNVNGYEVYMKTNKGSYKKITVIKKGSTTNYTKKGLKKNSTYTFKVRAYKNVSNKKVYGSYSSTKKLKLK